MTFNLNAHTFLSNAYFSKNTDTQSAKMILRTACLLFKTKGTAKAVPVFMSVTIFLS